MEYEAERIWEKARNWSSFSPRVQGFRDLLSTNIIAQIIAGGDCLDRLIKV